MNSLPRNMGEVDNGLETVNLKTRLTHLSSLAHQPTTPLAHQPTTPLTHQSSFSRQTTIVDEGYLSSFQYPSDIPTF
jgi:hypothetical protein